MKYRKSTTYVLLCLVIISLIVIALRIGSNEKKLTSFPDINASSIPGVYLANYAGNSDKLIIDDNGSYMLKYGSQGNEIISIYGTWKFDYQNGSANIWFYGLSSGRDPLPADAPEYKKALRVWPQKNVHSTLSLAIRRNAETGKIYIKLHSDTDDYYQKQ